MLYAPYEANYQGKPTKNGKFFFYILGAEGKKIGKSFFYGSADDMQKAIGLLLGSEIQRVFLMKRNFTLALTIQMEKPY